MGCGLVITDGQTIGYLSAAPWLYSVPWGFQKQIKWVSQRYNNPGIWVMENGIAGPGDVTLEEGKNDPYRIEYYSSHLDNLKQAMDSGVKVRGYTAWSICDVSRKGEEEEEEEEQYIDLNTCGLSCRTELRVGRWIQQAVWPLLH